MGGNLYINVYDGGTGDVLVHGADLKLDGCRDALRHDAMLYDAMRCDARSWARRDTIV